MMGPFTYIKCFGFIKGIFKMKKSTKVWTNDSLREYILYEKATVLNVRRSATDILREKNLFLRCPLNAKIKQH